MASTSSGALDVRWRKSPAAQFARVRQLLVEGRVNRASAPGVRYVPSISGDAGIGRPCGEGSTMSRQGTLKIERSRRDVCSTCGGI